ncbi:MAG: O-antigen ligase family protein [Mucilaginibacter sp.]|nr:O-antigen ligase family protein [Mucilaginibacter sp.]
MRELLLIKDNLANKISYYHLMLFLLSLPFDLFYNHLILASYAVHTVIQFKKSAVKPVFNLRTSVLTSVFFVTLASTIYTINPSHAFTEWELDTPILLLPLLLCFNQLDLKRYSRQLLMAFALGCTATILYLYADAFVTIRHYQMPLSSILSPAFTNHNFSEPIDMHATFFSLQIALALIYLLSRLIGERLTPANQLFYTICCVVLSAGIIQLSSKSIFAALLLIINVAFPYFLLEGSRRRQFIMISIFVSCMAAIGIFNTHALNDRYLSELKEDLSPSFPGQTVEPRLERWKIAAKLIRNSPIIGYGAGSEIQLLREQYFAKKFYSSFLHHLNSHNEYLSFLIKSGIWGLAVYLATLVYGFKKAIRKRDVVFFSFIALVAIVSLSENILDVDKGVIFYSFFFSFFVFAAEQKEPINIPIKGHKYLRKVATKRAVAPSSL